MATIVECYCCSVGCVAECLLINCAAAAPVVPGHSAVAELVAYLVVHSFAVIALTYSVVIFVNFVDCYDG